MLLLLLLIYAQLSSLLVRFTRWTHHLLRTFVCVPFVRSFVLVHLLDGVHLLSLSLSLSLSCTLPAGSMAVVATVVVVVVATTVHYYATMATECMPARMHRALKRKRQNHIPALSANSPSNSNGNEKD